MTTFVCAKEDVQTLKKCVEIYLGDYTPTQQYAASILMKMILKNKQYHELADTLREKTGFKVNNRQSSKVITWAKKVKKVGKCEVCGSRDNLHAHHIVPWEYSIKGRTDLSNGQCLCEDCHKMMHNDDLWIEYMKKKVSKNE